MTFKNFLKDGLKKKQFGDDPEGDFARDFFRKGGGHAHAPFKTWPALHGFLSFSRACPEAVQTGKRLFKLWQQSEEIARKQKLEDKGLVDRLNENDIKKIKKALRQVWSWSHSRRLVAKRCDLGGGYSRCEHCKKKCPKIFIDHIKAVGTYDKNYIDRLFVSSDKMQGLCNDCHKVKTKVDLKEISTAKKKSKRDDFY